MSAVFDKVCPFCGRLQLLWGGDTCDVCDRDSNGVNDRDEPVSVPSTVDEHLLFPPKEKGWMAIGGRKCQKFLPCHSSLVEDITKRELVARALTALHRRFTLEGYGNCETGYIVTTKSLIMRGSMPTVKL